MIPIEVLDKTRLNRIHLNLLLHNKVIHRGALNKIETNSRPREHIAFISWTKL